MITPKIKNRSSWPVLDDAAQSLAHGEMLSGTTFAAIADRLRSAIESPDAQRVETASSVLEDFLRAAFAGASPAVQAVSRGQAGIDAVSGADAATIYALGKVAFAQLLAARIADTRVDARFIQHVMDARYFPLVQELRGAPRSVKELASRTAERIETVSRKLGVLRGLGIVGSRKQGNKVMNLLTPVAEEILAMHGAAAIATDRAAMARSDLDGTLHDTRVPDEAARDLIYDLRDTLPPHMQEHARFVGRNAPRKAA